MARLWKRIAAVFLGLFMVLALLEGGLWIAAWIAAPASRAGSAAYDPNKKYVFFLGDSHTYGSWVPDDRTMPAIAGGLSERHDPPGFVPVNLGRPAAPSWVARAELERALALRRPAAVVIRVGFNNHYSAHPDRARWYERLRITKAARITYANVRQWLEGQRSEGQRSAGPAAAGSADVGPAATAPVSGPAPVGELRGGAPELERLRAEDPSKKSKLYELVPAMEQDFATEVSPGLRADLLAMAAAAKGAGARVFFLAYLDRGTTFDNARGDLAWAASETGSVYVELKSIESRARQHWDREQLVYPDGHPRTFGYALEAAALVEAMQKSGFLRGTPVPDPIDSLSSVPRVRARKPPRVEVREAKVGVLRVGVTTEPNARGRVLVGPPGRGLFFDSEFLDIEASLMARLASDHKGLEYRTDAEGRAEVEVPAELINDFPKNLRVLAILGSPDDLGSWPPAVSAPLDLEWPPPVVAR